MNVLIILLLAINSISHSSFAENNPVFDKIYDIYPKDDSNAAFGYNFNQVCRLRLFGDVYYMGLEEAYGILKTPLTRLQHVKKDSEIHNCFNWHGYSYIMFGANNRTHIMRGRTINSFKFPEYDKLLYDHLSSKLYAFQNISGQITEFNLVSLENFWLYENYAQKLIRERHSVSLSDFLIQRVQLNHSISDIMIYNNTVYYITASKQINKMNINDKLEEFVMSTNRSKFDFIPFAQFSRIYQNSPESLIKLSSNPEILVPLPSSNIKHDGTSLPLIFALYFLDASFIILTLLLLRYLYNKSLVDLAISKFTKKSRPKNKFEESVELMPNPYRPVIVKH